LPGILPAVAAVAYAASARRASPSTHHRCSIPSPARRCWCPPLARTSRRRASTSRNCPRTPLPHRPRAPQRARASARRQLPSA
jgi:hypothetical protein